MTREELVNLVCNSKSNNLLIEVATGVGKTRAAILKAEQWWTPEAKILIVIPRKHLAETTWNSELRKWNLYDKLSKNITFVTYVSLPKVLGTKWDVIIFDEGHHTSERCRDALIASTRPTHTIVLSATIKKDIKFFFKIYCKYQLEEVVVDTVEAIEDKVLPEPRIVLMPLTLECGARTFVAQKFKQTIPCSQRGYYNITTGVIEWYKSKSNNVKMKQIWLHLAGERLKWLAQQKELVVKNLLKNLSHNRVLTFCASIEQSAKLDSYCVNSKVGTDNLTKFNERKIKHIAAVGMLDEGANLTSCQVGLFMMINSSERLNIQRIGRILRHPQPVLIFPYYKDTREQEIIEDLIAGYKQELVTTVTDIENFKLN